MRLFHDRLVILVGQRPVNWIYCILEFLVNLWQRRAVTPTNPRQTSTNALLLLWQIVQIRFLIQNITDMVIIINSQEMSQATA